MTAVQPLVVCQDVGRTFGAGAAAVVAVHGTSCTVEQGARIAIAGPSGSGKSTLLHLLAGLEQPTRGELHWPQFGTAREQLARHIGVIFQGPSLVPALDVAENVALPLVLAGVEDEEVKGRVDQAMDLVGVDELAGKLPEELSGGQGQRVVVARVLAQRPRLVLADEPTGQLDLATGQHLVDVLLAAAEEIGAGLLVTTHDRAVVERLHTHWFMHEGRLRTATTQEVGA